MSILQELRRRKVLRLTALYIVGAWVVLQVADLAFESWDIASSALRYVWLGAILGFPIALIFGWRYDITAHGIVRTPPTDAASQIDLSLRRSDYVILALLMVVAVGVIYPLTKQISDSQSPQQVEITQRDMEPNSIAVLPFVNMSDDASNEYFSDGVSEELLNLLTKVPQLQVISRSSAFSFKGKNVDIPTIARQLNVAHVLEGSVRKAGNQLRITVQLIDSVSDTNLWSETYDRTLNDIFAIQGEIANEVVQALVTTLLGEATPKVRETDQEAYVLYLRGRHFAQASTLEGFQKADTYLHEALAIDPDYTPAWTALGSMLANGARAGFLGYDEGFRQARAAYQKALELDPDFADAFGGLAYIAMMYDLDFKAAAEYIQRARNLAPNSIKTLGISSTFAEILGRIDQAIELGERALRIDPLNVTSLVNQAAIYSYADRFDQAEESLNKALELRPDTESALLWLAKLHLRQGRPDAALSAAQKITNEQLRLWTLPMAYHDLRQAEASDMALNKLKETYADTAASFIAENHAWRGEIDFAFDWLDRAIEEGQFMWGSLVFDPGFQNLHTDPRWQDVRIRVGRSEEQLKKIEF
jgi:TolB-like protein/cytochrome c-type biogenesis protein CcmH/NrfG